MVICQAQIGAEECILGVDPVLANCKTQVDVWSFIKKRFVKKFSPYQHHFLERIFKVQGSLEDKWLALQHLGNIAVQNLIKELRYFKKLVRAKDWRWKDGKAKLSN